MIKEEFKDIAPIDDADFDEKMQSLVNEPGFEHAVRYMMPTADYDKMKADMLSVHNKEEFQLKIMYPFLEMLASRFTDGVTSSGISNIKGVGTFITNHRDIVLDASFLNLCLIRAKIPTSEIAIGNNLLIYEWIEDLVKLNKSFIVKRNLEMRQALEAAKQLSAYIHYCIQEKNQSVWIAQREGRSKDSSDHTQESLIKMMALAGDGDMLQNVMEVKLMPTAISYEYDPNDYLKAREFLLRSKDPDFKKSQRDDLFSMETGLVGNKGRVHFSIGECINPQLERLTDITDKNELVRAICAVIDNTIHAGFHIYPINYIAYDRLNGTDEFSHFYTNEDVKKVDEYVEGQLAKVAKELPDPVSDEDYRFMIEKMWTMYANPLKNKLTVEAVHA